MNIKSSGTRLFLKILSFWEPLNCMIWGGVFYIDTRLAMGLRSAAYCCQSVTEIIAKIVSMEAHILVYLDDFGGAELADKAHASFDY